MVEEAPQCVERLQSLGMEFDRDSGELATTLEAAHSHRRVLHVQDRTGRELVEVLEERVAKRTNLLHRRGVRVTQLWVENQRCCGVQVLDGPKLQWIPARAVVLATGGGGHLFANTTNPAQASGEGLVLAWRAGAAIEDLEFVQFHPTALKSNKAPCFLISEALRGEGAVLVDPFGKSPVAELQGRDLAPRDQVSRALLKAMQRHRVNHMGLDLKPISKVVAEARFPNILQRCRELGIDPLKSPIPVAPAAHYWMGGVATNLQSLTTLPGLYAVGEVSCTGLHGANRLASNSLMECLVFAREMASIELGPLPKVKEASRQVNSIDVSLPLVGIGSAECLVSAIDALRDLCWKEAGVDRSMKGMQRALVVINKDFETLQYQPLLDLVENQQKYISYIFNDIARRNLNLLLDLSHRELASKLLLEACLFRKESRGGHFRTDAPSTLPYWQCHSRQVRGKPMSTRYVNT